MYLSNEHLLVILVVGIVAGWIAGKVVRGGGFGLLGNIVLGIIGAVVAGWLLPQLGIAIGVGIVRAITRSRCAPTTAGSTNSRVACQSSTSILVLSRTSLSMYHT